MSQVHAGTVEIACEPSKHNKTFFGLTAVMRTQSLQCKVNDYPIVLAIEGIHPMIGLNGLQGQRII